MCLLPSWEQIPCPSFLIRSCASQIPCHNILSGIFSREDRETEARGPCWPPCVKWKPELQSLLPGLQQNPKAHPIRFPLHEIPLTRLKKKNQSIYMVTEKDRVMYKIFPHLYQRARPTRFKSAAKGPGDLFFFP